MKSIYIPDNNPQFDQYVQHIQTSFNNVGSHFHYGIPMINPIDGKYGFKTAKIVMEYQKKWGIKADGIWGPQTKEALLQKMRELQSILTANPTPSKASFFLDELFNIKAEELIKNVADVINDISDTITKQVCKVSKLGDVKNGDINSIIKNMIDKPNVAAMRKKIEDNVWKEIREKARKNTNVRNYNHNKQNYGAMREIQEAQRQASQKAFSNQTKSAINKTLYRQVFNHSIEELEKADIKKRIVNAIKMPKGGGFVISALSFLPLIKHFCELVWKVIHNQPIEETIILLVKDIVNWVVGILIGIAVTAIVSAIGLTGGVAIVAIIAIGIILGVLISLLFPDWDENIAKVFVNWIKNTADEIGTISQNNESFYCSPIICKPQII